MQTLKDEYKALISNRDRWSYYDCPSTLNYNTLTDNEKAYEFIKKYFKCGEKENLFDDLDIYGDINIIKDRASHIVSTYLLGILIAESFHIDFKNMGNFKYLWFLASLYHDIGYVFEENENDNYLKMLRDDGLEAIQKILNIKYLRENEFRTYSRTHINIYLSHRAGCSGANRGVIDHGIAGGLLLYDRLRKNFETAWEKAYGLGSDISRESFYYNGLRFSNRHYRYYAKAADAIISHNVWIDTLNSYLSEEGKTSYKEKKIGGDNCIAFVLALADTIEPVKKFGIGSLELIKYEESDDSGFRISIQNLKNGDACSYISRTDFEDIRYKTKHNCDNYINCIKGLPSWLDVDVIDENNGIFLFTRQQPPSNT